MKKEIHPQYNAKATAKCACGATYVLGSTLADISVEICSNCHPFYTGQDKVLDTAGRVEKFKARSQKKAAGKAPKKAAAKSEVETPEEAPEQSTEEK